MGHRWTWESFHEGGIIQLDEKGRTVSNEPRSWHGEWQDPHGNMVAYHLNAGGKTNMKRRHVVGYATYTPKTAR